MLAFDVLVRGRVSYEVAGGGFARIPQGRCRVEAHEGFVSLVWADGAWRHSASLTAQRFEDYLEAGAILVLDPAQLRHQYSPIRS